jgi:hypothetical protein
MPSPWPISLILSLSVVAGGILAWLFMDLPDFLWPSRTDRLIRSSTRQLRKLNESEHGDEMRHYFTLVDGNEKEMIDQYCKSENMSMDEFLTTVALDDAKSWKTMKDELQLILGPEPALAKPPKTTDEHLRWLLQITQVEAIFFRLSAEEYDKVSHHLERGRLSVRYLGRLAAATIGRKRTAVD